MAPSSYPWPSSVNVGNFVTVKPCLMGVERKDFKIWKQQMLCLLSSQDVVGFVEGETPHPHDSDEHKAWRRTDCLVKGWILGSIGKDALEAVWNKETAMDVWQELHKLLSDEENEKYPWPSAVNVAEFVKAKPCIVGDESENYEIWKKQMRTLLKDQKLEGFINGVDLPPKNADDQKAWRRTDRLVRLWILGSIGKDAANAVMEENTARDLWLKLELIFHDKEAYLVTNNKIRDEYKRYLPLFEAFDRGDLEAAIKFLNTRYLPLYQAAQTGDWETARTFFENINDLGTTVISSEKETALHVSVLTGKSNDFVKKLVVLIPREMLAVADDFGDTALHNAALVGNTEAAMVMVNKNPELLYISNNDGKLAVMNAAVNCKKDTLEFLISSYEANKEHAPLGDESKIILLNQIIRSEFVGIALDFVKRYSDVATLKAKEDNESALSTIAQTVTLFPRLETFSCCQKFIYHRIPTKKSKYEDSQTSAASDIENISKDGAEQNYSIYFQKIFRVRQKMEFMIWRAIKFIVPQVKELMSKKEKHEQALELAEYLCDQLVSLPEEDASPITQIAMKKAAKNGISEIVEMIIRKYPDVIFHKDSRRRNVVLVAATYRFENVINLFNSMSDRKYILYHGRDNRENNLMHICGKLSPLNRLNLVPGAALQMQRELQWFKEMEKLVPPSWRKSKNKDKQTPRMIFTKEHEKLKEDGERWMKDTANACTIAAALIATVMFAAAFTVPGGLHSTTGIPLFSSRPALNLFAVSDAISLFTSILSLLMFLSILTSRYAEEDFLYVLPKRLSIGLLSLFVSITFMMVAFSATFYLMFRKKGAWYQLLLGAVACLPVTSFVMLQFPLLVDVVYTTYGPGIFGKKNHRYLY